MESRSVGLGLLLVVQSRLLGIQCPPSIFGHVRFRGQLELRDPQFELSPELGLHTLLEEFVVLLHPDLVITERSFYLSLLRCMLSLLSICSNLYLLLRDIMVLVKILGLGIIVSPQGFEIGECSSASEKEMKKF